MAKQNNVNNSQKVKWRMKGKWLKNCSCDSGCPCDFWANPTHHKCEGMVGMIVDEGHFGDASLKGAKFVVTLKFPGPLHEGKGVVQPFFDDKMTKEQMDAIGQILMGKAGNIWFDHYVYKTLCISSGIQALIIPILLGITSVLFFICAFRKTR